MFGFPNSTTAHNIERLFFSVTVKILGQNEAHRESVNGCSVTGMLIVVLKSIQVNSARSVTSHYVIIVYSLMYLLSCGDKCKSCGLREEISPTPSSIPCLECSSDVFPGCFSALKRVPDRSRVELRLNYTNT